MRVLKPVTLPNGFTWLPVHFSADPAKASFEWREVTRAAYPRPTDFDKEMEIDFALHVGAPAYPRFNDLKHVAKELPYDDRRPLWVAMDFNANPMSLIVAQHHSSIKKLFVLKEFVYAATIDEVINDFRNHYSQHRAEVVMYGDATSGTTAQTAKSNWDIVRMGFRGYHVQPIFKLPMANPRIGDRLNAVNRLLSGEGPVEVVIDGSCIELIRDFREVILTPDGKKIHKETDLDDPYYYRTHSSDAFGYMVYREWSTVSEVMRDLSAKREPMNKTALVGDIDWGRKAKLDQQKRKPLNKGRVI